MAAYTGRPGVDWGEVAQAINVDSHLRAQEEARKVAAIRWQGQQDYQTLIGSGVDPAEALRRTAHKLYFGMNGTGLAAAIRATQPKAPPEEIGPVVMTEMPPGSGNFVAERKGSKAFQILRPKAPSASERGLTPTVAAPLYSKALQNKLTSERLAATAKPGGTEPNPDLYSNATNSAAIFGRLADQFAPYVTNSAPSKIAAPSPSEMQGPPTSAITPPASTTASKPLSREQAAAFLQQAGGDKAKAREMARQAGYSF